MTSAVIEIEGLRKEYRSRRRRTVAIEGLDLTVPEGSVFGFLGPNGSGKTTTIRCLLGLVRPSAGQMRLLGTDVPVGLATTLRRVGSIVESPALFPTLSGRENLRLLGAIDRIGPARVDHVLDQVGLGDRGSDLVRRYSLGMRQRLALAAALLKDPDLLVLDEPANGLDPAGIRQIRELLRSLAREGRTVFVSSHILSEVEQTCDTVAIVNRGRCITQGRVADVLASAGGRGLQVRVDDLAIGLETLRRAGLPARRVDGHLHVDVPADAASRVTETLARDRIWVTELRPTTHSLEDLFLELTDAASEAGPAPAPTSEEVLA